MGTPKRSTGGLRGRTEAALVVLLVFAAAALINALAARHPVRLDLTADGRHTLGAPTLALLDQLEGPLEVRAFLPTHVQPPYSTVVRRMADLLEAFRAAGGDRVRLQVHDPSDASLSPEARAALRAEATGYGVREAELQVRRDDRQTMERVLFGVALLHRDRQAVVPPVNHPDQLEFLLAKALRDVVGAPRRPPVIGVSTGHDEPPLIDSPLAPLLSNSGTLRAVRLDGAPLPPDVDALLIFAPRRALGARARWVVEQHLLRGGAVVALLDHHTPSVAFPEVLVDTQSGLEPLLRAQGLHLDPVTAVLDRSENAPAPVGRDAQGRTLTAHHPAWIRSRDLDPRHPITRGLAGLTVPYAVPLTVGADATHLRVTPLVRAGAAAVWAPQARSPDPARYATPAPEERPAPGAVVALVAEGPFKPVDPSAPAPERVRRPDDAAAPPDPPALAAAQGDGRLLVVTSGARLLGAQEDALLFLQNALDWAVTETDLSALRARTAVDAPLRPTSEATRAWVRFGNILGMPALLLAFGAAVGWRRRRRSAGPRRAAPEDRATPRGPT